MSRSALSILLLTAALPAQDPAPWRLGVLFWHDSPNDRLALAGIERGLAELGAPHRLIVHEAGGDRERAAAAITALRDEGTDLIFAMGTQAALLCAEHERELPIVFTAVTNPVESGVVPSWQGSGRNLAGNSNWIAPEIVLQVFRLAVPDLRRLGMLRTSRAGVVSGAELSAMRRHLAEPGAAPVAVDDRVVDSVDDFDSAVAELARGGAQAIWVGIDLPIYENMAAVRRAALPHGIPVVSSSLKATEQGAVAGVIVDYETLGARAVEVAAAILARGADPATLPIGTLRSYRVVVDLDAARECGYELPLSLLVVADRILEREPGR